MPLFSNRFTHKKSPIRKSKPLSSLQRDLNQNFDNSVASDVIKLQLEDKVITFDQKVGKWITSDESPDLSLKMKEIESSNQLLLEENKVLRIKIEILLQMLTEATAELQL